MECRKLAEMGHSRSAKKCREKFENIDKYYRRTKDGRTGHGEGNTYHFFTELESLHGAAASSPRPPTPVAAIAPPPAAQAITAAASTNGNLLRSGLSGAARPGPAVSTGATPRATAGAVDFYEDGCMRDDDGGRNPPSPWTRR
jgi:hypothetical protein